MAPPDEEANLLDDAMRTETVVIDPDEELGAASDGRRSAKSQTRNEVEARRGWNADIESVHLRHDVFERGRAHQSKTNLEWQVNLERVAAEWTRRIRISRQRGQLHSQLQ
jgi:hypothetical protein